MLIVISDNQNLVFYLFLFLSRPDTT